MALTQVSTAGVKDDAVTAGKIPANAVGSSELADNAVDTAAIADDAVTNAKLALPLDLADNENIRLGTGNDLRLYHDGSNSYINNFTGNLELRPKSGEAGLIMVPDGTTKIYYDGSKKLETTSAGTTITGALTVDNAGGDAILGQHLSLVDNGKVKLGTGDDLQIYHDGSHSYILENGTGDLKIETNGTAIQLGRSNGEIAAKFIPDGAVELYYDNVKKLNTFDSGVVVSGDIQIYDGSELQLGSSSDLKIYHNGSHSYITGLNTGNMYIRHQASGGHLYFNSHANTEFYVNNGNDAALKMINNGAVEIYYDNAKKFETHSAGCIFTGDLYGLDNAKVRLGNSNDLEIYHNGSNSYVANTTGQLVFEGDDLMFMNAGRTESLARFQNNGAAELYHDNIKRLGTSNAGTITYGSVEEDGRTDWYIYTGSVYLADGESHNIVTNASGYTWAEFDVYIISLHGSIGRAHWAGNCSQYTGGHDYQQSNSMSYANIVRFNNGSDSGIKISRTGTYGNVGFHWTAMCRHANSQGVWNAGSSSHTTRRAKL